MKSPLSHRKIGALDWFCLRAIAWYQRQISPRKGWRCAHARLHGGTGCSGFARESIEKYGLRDAAPMVRARFDDCKKAGQTLRAQHGDGADKNNKRRDKRPRSSPDWCNWADCTFLEICDLRWCRCADALVDCGPGDTGCCDIGSCSPCD